MSPTARLARRRPARSTDPRSDNRLKAQCRPSTPCPEIAGCGAPMMPPIGPGPSASLQRGTARGPSAVGCVQLDVQGLAHGLWRAATRDAFGFRCSTRLFVQVLILTATDLRADAAGRRRGHASARTVRDYPARATRPSAGWAGGPKTRCAYYSGSPTPGSQQYQPPVAKGLDLKKSAPRNARTSCRRHESARGSGRRRMCRRTQPLRQDAGSLIGPSTDLPLDGLPRPHSPAGLRAVLQAPWPLVKAPFFCACAVCI